MSDNKSAKEFMKKQLQFKKPIQEKHLSMTITLGRTIELMESYATQSQANTLTDELKEAFKAGQSAETSADADQFDDSEFNEWAKSRLSETSEGKKDNQTEECPVCWGKLDNKGVCAKFSK